MKYFKAVFLTIIIISIELSAQNNIKIMELNYPDSLNVIKRADWGWELIRDEVIKDQQINYITVHHGGVEFHEKDSVAVKIKNLQKWSRNVKKWIDIPYHFMIDLTGKIYEARPVNFPGDTNTEYDPSGHVLVEVMGNYEIQEPNESQLSSLVSILAYLAERFEVDTENIKTHKDYSKITVCPGKNLYKYFSDGSINSQIKKIIPRKNK